MVKPYKLNGFERVLIAEVPRAQNRWKQVHLNAAIVNQFFDQSAGETRTITTRRVESDGEISSVKERKIVYSASNGNVKLELDFGEKVADYPSPASGRAPLIVVVEESAGRYRFRTLMPDDDGYPEVLSFLLSSGSTGRGKARRITSLRALEGAWPESMLVGQGWVSEDT